MVSLTTPLASNCISADQLQVGDILLLDTSASFLKVQSRVRRIRRPWYLISNDLIPEPYEIFLPASRTVTVLRDQDLYVRATKRFLDWARKYKRKKSKQSSSASKRNFPKSVLSAYKILGTPSDISLHALKKKYKILVRQNHPDVCSDSGAEERLKKINLAYTEILSFWERSSL